MDFKKLFDEMREAAGILPSAPVPPTKPVQEELDLGFKKWSHQDHKVITVDFKEKLPEKHPTSVLRKKRVYGHRGSLD